MKDPTCKELDLSSVNRNVAWLVYVDMEYMKENMKSLKREMHGPVAWHNARKILDGDAPSE